MKILMLGPTLLTSLSALALEEERSYTHDTCEVSIIEREGRFF